MNKISGGLYLLCEREFIKTNETIYKIGRGNDIIKRVNQYPNGSIVYLIIECENNIIHESKLIELFKKKFINEKYIGTEYFNGNIKLMKTTIIKYMKSNLNKFNIIDNEIIIERVNKYKKINIPKYAQNIYNENIIKINKIEQNEIKQNKIEQNEIEQKYNKNIINKNNCSHCKNNFDNKYNLLNHLKICKYNITKNITKIVINANNNQLIKNKMSDRICLTCGLQFKFPCQLERHITGKKQCKSKSNQIQEFTCKLCKCNYSNKYSLIRHIAICKKNKNNNKNNNVSINSTSIPISQENININNLKQEVKLDTIINKLIDNCNIDDTAKNMLPKLLSCLISTIEINNLSTLSNLSQLQSKTNFVNIISKYNTLLENNNSILNIEYNSKPTYKPTYKPTSNPTSNISISNLAKQNINTLTKNNIDIHNIHNINNNNINNNF